ncbi:hypothetical protein V1514DRAFT_337965 [Lipomyces japonicus]|uniref:uncharacterized protein n=1 Tax=Lipomyces japonicus TaxID=56871 RepID=UPI0034CD8B8B
MISSILRHTQGVEFLSLYTSIILRYISQTSNLIELEKSNVWNLIWDIYVCSRDRSSSSSKRHLTTSLISLLFHPRILELTAQDSDRRDQLADAARSFVPLGFARRLILPTLAEKFWIARNENLDIFQTHSWIGSILVGIYVQPQLKDNVFLIERPVSDMFDSDFGEEQNMYSRYYPIPESYARAYAVGTLASLPSHASDFAHATVRELVSNEAKYPLFKTTSGDALAETSRIAYSELLLTLDRFIIGTELEEDITKKILSTLSFEFSPTVRTMFEWQIARIIASSNIDKKVKRYLYTPLSKSEARPRFLASLLTILVLLSRFLARKEGSSALTNGMILKSAEFLVPFAMNNRATVRHQACSLIMGLKSLLVEPYISGDLKNVISVLEDQVSKSPQFGTFKHGDELLWDIESDYNLSMICGGIARKVSEHRGGGGIDPEVLRIIFHDKVGYMPIGHAVKDDGLYKKSTMAREPQKEYSVTTSEQAISSALQIKSRAWQSADSAAPGLRTQRSTKGHLIVLASLVDKAPNLGGICRASDVLGAELLCLNNLSVTKDREFMAVAVTADKWMPMSEVPVETIPAFLHAMKRDGYALIGLEQTDTSVVLDNELKFPNKAVLVLGKEKEGIVPEVLRELDFCIEIKQTGIVRSMNIQTATAVVVHAYSVQHC